MEDTSAAEGKSKDFDQDNWKKILDSDYWKLPPNWTRVSTQKKGIWDRVKKLPGKIYEFLVVRISYEDYFASQLRSRYMNLEGNFRPTLIENKDQDLSQFIKELLILSKQILEKEKLGKMDLISASSLLDEAEERMVWILPKDIKISKIHEISLDLDRFSSRIKDIYEKSLKNCETELNECHLNQDNCSASIEEIVRGINKNILEKRINTGLQIERLRSLRFWGLILLIFYVLLFPMLGIFDRYNPYIDLTGYLKSALDAGSSFSKYQGLIPAIGGWAVALSFCVIGGIGGFLSGLLQVRTTETNLELYEEAVLLFQIRPIFGAFSGLVMFMLISLGSLSSVFSDTQGSMALAAFLSGFSERFFLKLLNTELKPKQKDEIMGKERSKSNNEDRPI